MTSFGTGTFGSGTFGDPTPDATPTAEAVADLQLVSQRAFPDAQRLLSGPVLEEYGVISVDWYDSSAYPLGGAVAVARRGGPHEELVGEVIRVDHGERRIFVFVDGRADVPADLSLSRRAFLAIDNLARESLPVVVSVVE